MNIWGPRAAPRLTRDPYSHWLTNEYSPLTNEYKNFIFLLLPILAASSDGWPPKQVEYIGIYTQQQDIQVHNNRKENKFDKSRQFEI
jgi:hypothetical protein